MIETTSDLSQYLDNLSGDFRAMDTEADSLHRYFEKISLLQFTDGENHSLIDPLAIDDLGPLIEFLKDAQLWMHGADYDIMIMRRDLGVVPPIIWDTQIAARLLGVRKFGYANLVEYYLGVELSKSSQKADWSKRPLTEKMKEYALNDVAYLKPMVDILLKDLNEKGRYEWFVESCEWARTKVLERPVEKEDPWRISGSGRLHPKGLAFLKALWLWRDGEAREWDRPTFMVCGNKQLISWVNDILAKKTPQLPKHFRTKRRQGFFKAIDEVLEMSESDYPQRPKRGEKRVKDEAFEARVDELIKHRDAAAEELDIDSSLIASRSVIESLAAGDGQPEELLMQWQRNLMKLEPQA